MYICYIHRKKKEEVDSEQEDVTCNYDTSLRLQQKKRGGKNLGNDFHEYKFICAYI